MQILKANHIKHDIQDHRLFDISQLLIHENERIGLVGSNGCGKTTLLRILSGEIKPDEGMVVRKVTCKLIPQLKNIDTTDSGGEVTQKYIQQALAEKPGLLIADEPTTNLDTAHIEWVEKELKIFRGALLLVSHDRAFLDALCTTIWEISDGCLRIFKGNYRDYAEQKELERRQEQQAFEQNEKEKRKIIEAIRQKEQKAERATKKPKNLSGSEARITGSKPYFAKKQKKLQQTAKAMETRLEKLGEVKKTKELPPLKMDLPNADSFNKRVIIRAHEHSGQIGQRVLWKNKSFTIKGGDKLAIIGTNGSGKTTFIKKLIEGAEDVTVSPIVKIGYFSQNLSVLDTKKTIIENVQLSSKQSETTIRTVLARMRFFNGDVYKLAGVLSGGERVKVVLAKIFLSDANVLVLDEPTNYLDMDAVEALEQLLQEYEGSVIFVSHDRCFIENVATRIFEIKDQEIMITEGALEEKDENQFSRSDKGEQLLIIETKISEVLGKLSIMPNAELEQEFQRLLKHKRELME
ncbi:ABC-F type ribosomal protection protein [Aciduricibacillus chroicocephali]|uniref:ABC-F type ribosomal protection protein n=1 Tax=Aciduricibacillus chroicocephali TaxID=3054939 RepID=A0ABY9KW24_9BACI|nr:ABC-F type ribosomal protection protein [Bacillaceae bacterium 44XB]